MGEGTQSQQQLLRSIAAALARVERQLSSVVPPNEVRAAIGDATEHIADVADTTEIHSPQLREMIQWMHERMSGEDLSRSFENQDIIVRQLISIMQGTRDDIVLLRADFRRLSALLEQTLHVRVEDEERGIVWNVGDADRRKAG